MSIERELDKEKMVYTYNGIVQSFKKEMLPYAKLG